MLSVLWWLPVVVAVVATVVLWRGARSLAAEAARLHAAIAELRQLRPAVAEVRAAIAAIDAGPRGQRDLGRR
jgi:cytochrome c-type biogenesis protein CcmH/NrfF